MPHFKPGKDESILRKMKQTLNEDGFQPDAQLLASLIHSLPLNVFAKDLDGCFIFTNDFYCRSVRKTYDEIIGKNDFEIHPVEHAEKFRKDDKRIMMSLQAEMIEEEWKSIGGENAYIQVIKSPLFNNIQREKVIGVIGIFWDITRRKKTEIELAEERNLLRKLIDIVPDYIYVKDRESKFILANKAVADLMGAESPDKLLGRKDCHFYSKADAENFRRDEQQVIKTEKPIINKEESFNSPNGKSECILTSKLPLRSIEGNIVGLVGIGRKITEQKENERERMRLEKQLLHAQKMETVGTLAGGIAHDFNNLLMGIQGHAALMKENMDASHSSWSHIEAIEESVSSAAHLTNQLLGFAKGGKYEVRPTAFNELIDKTAEMFSRTRKEISILKTFEPALWRVETDKRQMEQVLLNLFINAWQAMPEGGSLFLHTENVLLDESSAAPYSAPPGRYVKISVIDTGEGMDEKTRRRIFDPFFTTKGIGRGTGLGLASVYGIITNHSGIIKVYSEPGRGTAFYIYLPASDNEDLQSEDIPDNTVLQGSETILLVDDEKMIIEVGKEILQVLGYRVFTAQGGEQAVKKIVEMGNEINLVILDLVMPEMDGSKTFDRLREIKPDLPVILSSGYSIDGQAAEILNRGCSGFIQKPFQLPSLSQTIRKALDKKSVKP